MGIVYVLHHSVRVTVEELRNDPLPFKGKTVEFDAYVTWADQEGWHEENYLEDRRYTSSLEDWFVERGWFKIFPPQLCAKSERCVMGFISTTPWSEGRNKIAWSLGGDSSHLRVFAGKKIPPEKRQRGFFRFMGKVSVVRALRRKEWSSGSSSLSLYVDRAEVMIDSITPVPSH